MVRMQLWAGQEEGPPFVLCAVRMQYRLFVAWAVVWLVVMRVGVGCAGGVAAAGGGPGGLWHVAGGAPGDRHQGDGGEAEAAAHQAHQRGGGRHCQDQPRRAQAEEAARGRPAHRPHRQQAPARGQPRAAPGSRKASL